MNYEIVTRFNVGQRLYSIYKNQIEITVVEGIKFECSHFGDEPNIEIKYQLHFKLQKIHTDYTEEQACQTFYDSVTELVNFIKSQSEDIEEQERKIQVHNLYQGNEKD